VNQAQRRFVVDRFGVHRADERQLVCDGTHVRQKLAQFHAALSARLELERRPQYVAALLFEMRLQLPRRVGLPMVLVQRGLGIEQIHLARSAVLKQTDNRLRAGRRVAAARAGTDFGARQGTFRGEMRKRQHAQRSGILAQ